MARSDPDELERAGHGARPADAARAQALRVLIVSQHFWPEPFPINAVAEDLAAAGLDVRVLTGQPNYPGGRVFGGYRALGRGVDGWRGLVIHRVPLVPRGRGALRLGLNYLSFVASAAAFGLRSLGAWRPQVVFVYATSPAIQALAAARIARASGARLVTWVQDLWPETLAATGHVRHPLVLAAVRRAMAHVYARSDLILAQSEGFARAVRKVAPGRRVAVHPNAAPPLAPAPPAVGPDGPFTVLFAGNFGLVQALDCVIDAAERLADDPRIRFVLAGTGRLDGWLRAEVARRGLANVRLTGWIDPEAMPALYAESSAVLATLAPGGVLELVVPSKLQTYLAAGRPIVAAMNGEGARVVRDSGAGVAVAAGDAAALAQAIRGLAALSPAERASMGARGRANHAQHYAPAVLTPALVGHLTSVVDGSACAC